MLWRFFHHFYSLSCAPPSSPGPLVCNDNAQRQAYQFRCLLQEAVTNDIKVQNVTLQHQQNVVTAVPVVFSVTYPTDEPAKRMPLLMLFNGASVDSYWYRRVISRLASKGYVVVTSDYYRPYTVPIPNLPSDARSAMAFS